MTTLSHEVDLDSGKEMPRLLLPVGWQPFVLTDYELVEKDPGTDGWKLYVRLDLQDVANGWKRSAYINWPKPGVDNNTVAFADRNGNEVSAAESKIGVIKKVISAFGGPESGKINPDIFATVIGRTAEFKVSHEEYMGEMVDRVDIQFGRGIRPA